MILGDNIFCGNQLHEALLSKKHSESGAIIFIFPVRDPNRYGVAEISENNIVIGIEEKPIKPKSPFAVTGLYFMIVMRLIMQKNSNHQKRGELEITDLNKIYIDKNQLECIKLDKNSIWLDSGTHESLYESSKIVSEIQKSKCMDRVSRRSCF